MFRYPLCSEEILRKKRALRKELLQKEGLVPKRVALLSGSTVGELGSVLELFLLDAGIRPDFYEGGFGRYREELLFDEPALRAFRPDILYLHTGIRNIDRLPAAGEGEEAVKRLFSEAWDKIESSLAAAGRYGCPVIVNNFEYPALRVLGSRESYDRAGKVRFVTELNLRLADYALAHDSVLIQDINYLASWYGLERWSDPVYYDAYKYGLNPDAIPSLCLSLASIIRAVFGQRKKVLLLDLDNTLWGGTVGDDGAEGIRLGEESPEGIAYLRLQRYVKELRSAGVLLGVVSKNEEAIAKSGFSHPSSALSPEDFSVFLANWDDKAGNIRRAAEQLNLGSDSFVLLDDNPAERALIEQALPEVEVAAFTSPERSALNLSHSGYFESASALSADDLKRAEMYRENAARETERKRYADYGEYLRSLGMRVYFSGFTKERRQRIAQLANRTNQFNLTAGRCTPEEIGAFEADGARICIAARLTDRFGDNGIVSELVAKTAGDRAEIELFLMSCRVFQRGLELAVFDELVRQAAARGVKTIFGRYVETPRNAVVRDLYPSLGFLSEGGEERIFRFDVPPDYQTKNETIEVFYE